MGKVAETQSQRLHDGYGVLKSPPIAAVSARFRSRATLEGFTEKFGKLPVPSDA